MAGLAETLYLKKSEDHSLVGKNLSTNTTVFQCLHCQKRKPNTFFWGKQLICKVCDQAFYQGIVRSSYFRNRESTWNGRASRKGIKGTFTFAEWRQLVRSYGTRCLCCKKKVPLAIMEPDHVLPLARGGTNHLWNIQPLCFKCNMAKLAKHIDFRPKPKPEEEPKPQSQSEPT